MSFLLNDNNFSNEHHRALGGKGSITVILICRKKNYCIQTSQKCNKGQMRLSYSFNKDEQNFNYDFKLFHMRF